MHTSIAPGTGYTSIAIVDDHILMAQALAELVGRFDTYNVLFCAHDGQGLMDQLKQHPQLEILILDVHMPEINGQETARFLRDTYPHMKVLALSMLDDETTIAQMLQLGVQGYLLKRCRPAELRQALDDIRTKGHYYSDLLPNRLTGHPKPRESTCDLNRRELDFIRWACSELTYVEIADKMCVSPRTVDGYRESVFGKLNVKTRQGLVMAAIRRKLV